MFLRGVGLIIAGALLLSHTSVCAESYVRVLKNGVVYYSFSGRAHTPPQPAVVNPPPRQWAPPNPRTWAIIPEPDQSDNLRPSLIKAVNRMESSYHPKASSSEGTPDLTQMTQGQAHDSQGDDFSQNIWLAPRYLGRLWAKIGALASLPSALTTPGLRRHDHQQAPPPIPEAQALVREACNNFLRYAQGQSAPSSQRQWAPKRGPVPNRLGYCFPVAQPCSFRDSWGEGRSSGRQHHAVDIAAQEGTRVYAATSGVIQTLATFPEAGLTLILSGQDGKAYGYMHLQRLR